MSTIRTNVIYSFKKRQQKMRNVYIRANWSLKRIIEELFKPIPKRAWTDLVKISTMQNSNGNKYNKKLTSYQQGKFFEDDIKYYLDWLKKQKTK